MAPQVTEICRFPLKPGHTATDPNTPDGQINQEAMTTLSDQDGVQKIYFGAEVEAPTNLRWFVDWNSRDHHSKFESTPEYGPFVKNLSNLFDGKPTIYHVAFNPHPPTTALSDTSAPATEVLTMYFPTSISSSDMDAHTSNMEQLAKAIQSCDGCKGYSAGWSLEEVPYNGSKAKVYLAVIGWQSVQHHMNARETQTFKDNAPLLKKDGGNLGLEVCHINAQRVDGGGLGAEERGALRGSAVNAQEEILNPQNPGMNAPKTKQDGTTTKNQTAP